MRITSRKLVEESCFYNNATTRPAAAAAISSPEARRPAAAVTWRVVEVVFVGAVTPVPAGGGIVVLTLVVRPPDAIGEYGGGT
jgi:hypothetical protein